MRSCGCPLGRGNDVGHKVSVDPVDDAGVHVCHLKQRGGLGVSGATISQITSAIRQSLPSSTITVMPALTCRKTGSALGAATPLAWSTDMPSVEVLLYYF